MCTSLRGQKEPEAGTVSVPEGKRVAALVPSPCHARTKHGLCPPGTPGLVRLKCGRRTPASPWLGAWVRAVVLQGGRDGPAPAAHRPTRPAFLSLLPQEILEEVVRELHKVKDEIIDGEWRARRGHHPRVGVGLRRWDGAGTRAQKASRFLLTAHGTLPIL